VRDLIPTIEGALGPDRVARLKKDEDAYQQFWIGVLEALGRADLNRETVGFLISNGYGAVRNMRKAGNSRSRMKACPSCGRICGNRTVTCPGCGAETVGSARVVSTSLPEGGEADFPSPQYRGAHDLSIDVWLFLRTLSGRDLYVARRVMVDRADLLFKNHLAQIGFELGVSKQRVSQIKVRVREAFRRWYYGT